MSEIIDMNKKENTTKENEKTGQATEPKRTTIEEAANALRSGTLELSVPILSRNVEISEIHYDFDKITGWEYLNAMDADTGNTNTYRISHKQAFALFTKAASKQDNSLDETDMKTRMGVADVMNAVRVATVFFVSTSQAAGRRISKK